MIKLKESERSRLLDYLMTEPEINMFFIGVIENHCIDSDEVAVYAEENPGSDDWDIVVLKYYDNYILYSHDDVFQINAVVDLLKEDIVDSINGKANVIRQIAPFFPHMKVEEKTMLRLDNLKETPYELGKVKIRLLTPKDAGMIIDLYAQNSENELNYISNREKYIDERRNNLAGEGIAVGLLYKNKLVSVAEITADNDLTGLIVGIATHPQYYGRGYATQAISALCLEAFKRGKKHICIFHDNPKVKSLLLNIGFEEKSQYALLH